MELNIIELFEKSVEQNPDKIALIFEDRSLTYRELSQEVYIISDRLQLEGIERGDLVGVVAPNSVEFVVLMLVASLLGITLLPQNTTLTSKMIISQFHRFGVKHIFVWHSIADEFYGKFEILLSIGNRVEGRLNYSDIVEDSIDREYLYSRSQVSIDQPFIITLTSGSTGDPKPIVLLQRTKINRINSTIELYSLTSSDIILSATPLYHSLAQRLILLPLLSGATAILMATFTPRKWLDNIVRYRVSFTMAVASQLRGVYQEMREEYYDIDSLKTIVSSSELLDISLKRSLVDSFGCNFYECYGTSEIACVTNISDRESHKLGSIGRAVPNIDIKIVRDDDSYADIDEVGEIVCKTPLAFLGYYDSSDMTKKAYIDGYFRTGDLGRFDSDGYLYFQGRVDDLIIVGGINIYPKDIESIINSHKKVSECSVIGLRDEKLGERVVAIVIASDSSLNIRELQRLSARELADFQQPREYILVQSLPKNSIGKVSKKEIVAKYNKEIK